MNFYGLQYGHGFVRPCPARDQYIGQQQFAGKARDALWRLHRRIGQMPSFVGPR